MTDDATGQQEDRKDHVEVSPRMTTTVAQSIRNGWGRWRSVLLVTWWCCVALSCICLIASAYGGMINPEITALGAILAMALPIFIMIVIVVGIISIWISRWAAVVCAAALIACSGPILEYAPVNFPRKMPDEQELRDNSFTFMSYNVYNFWQYGGASPNDTTNPTISYILKEDPDVACLIECLKLEPHFYSHVTQAQLDSLTTRYPYYKLGPEGSSLFSKYPITPIEIERPNSFANQVSAFNVSIQGRDVTVIAVHLASWGLGNDDRAMYNNFTHLGVLGKIWGVRQQWFDKLDKAFRERAKQADELRELINRIGGENVIVAGDFNDIPDSYALRTIMDDDFHSVYSERGLGPAITYHGNKFYFRIDHILYRGFLDPLWVRIGQKKYSDHFPVFTQFLFTDKS